MGRITKIAAVENANAIWEYDPSLPNNRILGGSLDVIAAIRMIAVNVTRGLRVSEVSTYVTYTRASVQVLLARLAY